METRGEVDRSFERLYRLHRGEVYGAALRELGNVHDAEDVTQAAFVDAYRAILRGSRPESPRAWLLAIAENVRRRRFRTARRRPVEQPVTSDIPAPELPHEQAQALRTALLSLPQLQREVFLLREIRGLSYEEIAARADASVGAVQMLLFRARQGLRAELEPPSTRGHALSLAWPAWLIQLAGRADRSLLTPRGAGAVGAAALVLGGSTAGLVELRQDADPRAPAARQVVTPAIREDVRAVPVAERRRAARPATRTAAPQRPAARAPGVATPAPVASVGDPEPAATPEPADAPAPVTPTPVETSVPEAPAPTPEPELPPVAEVVPALPAPSAVPPLPPVLPVPPPIELPPPPVELPPLPVELPAVPPVVVAPPLPPPPVAPPLPLP